MVVPEEFGNESHQELHEAAERACLCTALEGHKGNTSNIKGHWVAVCVYLHGF